MIFTDEENIGHSKRDSLYPSPIHEITSSAEGSPTSLKKIKTKYSLPQRKRGIVLIFVPFFTVFTRNAAYIFHSIFRCMGDSFCDFLFAFGNINPFKLSVP